MDEIKETVKEHERRIVALEKADAEFAIRLENLVKKIESLTSWIKALVLSILGTGVGFVIWYSKFTKVAAYNVRYFYLKKE